MMLSAARDRDSVSATGLRGFVIPIVATLESGTQASSVITLKCLPRSVARYLRSATKMLNVRAACT
jgi:hypothetical protein